jgi:hypothetical protein
MSDVQDRLLYKLTKVFCAISLAVFLFGIGSGCGPAPHRIPAILGAGRTNVMVGIPIAREFCSAFTNCDVLLASIVERRPYRRAVQLESDLFERYILYLNLIVEFDRPTNLEVVSHKIKGFYLSEVTSISVDQNGSTAYNFGQGFRFGEREWNILKTNGLRFEAIGIDLKTNAPVNGFRQAIDASKGSNW